MLGMVASRQRPWTVTVKILNSSMTCRPFTVTGRPLRPAPQSAHHEHLSHRGWPEVAQRIVRVNTSLSAHDAF